MTDGGWRGDLKISQLRLPSRGSAARSTTHTAPGIRAIPDALATLPALVANCVAGFGIFAAIRSIALPDMQLFHFSDDSAIATFTPRSVLVPSQRTPGMEWLNGPLVWAIEERVDFMYLFPRDCPRILIWATEQTNNADKMKWLGEYRAAAYVGRERLPDLATATLHRYDLPTDSFEDLHDAGMWVSRVAVKPLGRDTIFDLPSAFAPRGVDLRVVDSLLPLKPLWETTLHASGIRLRNARGWA